METKKTYLFDNKVTLKQALNEISCEGNAEAEILNIRFNNDNTVVMEVNQITYEVE